MIKIKGITKKYKKEYIFQNTSVQIKKNDIIGLVGENGVGKTTLLKIISGLLINYEGEYFLHGNPNQELNDIHHMFAVCIEEPDFYPDLSIIKNIRYFCMLSAIYLDDDYLYKKLKEFKLFHYKDIKFSQLSLGNKQKASLLRAFLLNKEIILLDEPFNGLDPVMKQEMLYLIKKENESGKTFIISSHLLGELAEISKRIWFIEDKKVSEIELKTMQDIYQITFKNSDDVLNCKNELKENIKIQREGNNIIEVEIINMPVGEFLRKVSQKYLVTEFKKVPNVLVRLFHD